MRNATRRIALPSALVAMMAGAAGRAKGDVHVNLDPTSFYAQNAGLGTLTFENYGVSDSYSSPDAVAYPNGPFGPSSLPQSGTTISSFGVIGGYLSNSGPVVTATMSAVNV